MNTIIIAVILMGAAGLILGSVIGFFAKIFRVESDPRLELVLELLPGANCGGCGRAGCADFAKAVVAGELQPGHCPVSSKEAVSSIAHALGIEVGNVEPSMAVICCSGDVHSTKLNVNYNGVSDCQAASLIAGGPKGCHYGCLGLATCARICPFGAIEIINSLAVVHPNLCVGCGKCVNICPRKIIKLVPVEAKVHVYCSSPDKGADKRKVCSSGCIGCRKCAKVAEGKFIFKGFCAEVDYSDRNNLPGKDILAPAGCPPGCLRSPKIHLELENQHAGVSAK